jgi:hypothetical protein
MLAVKLLTTPHLARGGHRTGRRRARSLSLAVVIFASLLVAPTAPAQVRVGRDSATRLDRFGRDLVYGTGMGLLFAGIDQLRNEPPEWGEGWPGYGRRAASDIGEFVIQEGTTEALAAVLKRPLDYTPCACQGTERRVGWALWQSVTDYTADGKHLIAAPRIVGAYVGSFAQATWRPTTSNRLQSALVNGTTSLLIGAGINVFYELRSHAKQRHETVTNR